jgi:TonB family protein
MPPAMKAQVMKILALLILVLTLVAVSALAQSGRKSAKPLSPAPPPIVSDPAEKPVKPPSESARLQVEARTGEEYECSNDDGLRVVVHSGSEEKVFAPKEVTSKAVIRSRPKPAYTPEARRKAVEGNIVVNAVLAANGKVFSVTIMNRGLPYGLNESAIRAACKIEFIPATKGPRSVSQWVKVEYPFRTESSINTH